MDTPYDDPTASRQRALDRDGAMQSSGAIPDDFLLRRIQTLEARLEAQAEALRNTEQEKCRLDEMCTQLREANEHLVLATVNAEHLREDAEATNRRQNEFLAMLAHELRNPLSPISMAASLLERGGAQTPQLPRLAQVIGRQVEHMAKLLDDLLDAARISSGKITLNKRPLALADVLQHALETIQPSVEQRRQTLHAELPDETLVVDGDPVRLAQIFSNLLGNASKYTGDGGMLRVAVRAEPDAAVVGIEDNGSGISPEIIPYLFDLFTQGPRSLARSEGGLGVGLNVVRNLVNMHGGTVEAASPGPGRGSRFTVRLPLCARDPVDAAPADSACAGARRRVLVVEDNPDTRTVLAACLEGAGHEVITAADGRSGLAAALERHCDVIVCDIGLPGLDGLGLMRILRTASDNGGMRPLAIAVSGYGQPEDRARGIEAGFDHYLVKPVALEGLLALVSAGAGAAAPA
jgi:signal transduction histidine kinase/ActR/RegA family two-component response regulator